MERTGVFQCEIRVYLGELVMIPDLLGILPVVTLQKVISTMLLGIDYCFEAVSAFRYGWMLAIA